MLGDAGAADAGRTPWVFSDAGTPPLLGNAALGAVRFRSRPTAAVGDNHGVLSDLPAGFGQGEFTFELWFQASDLDRIPAGAGYDRRLDWATTDSQPYSSGSWWYDGNFLIDGHNNADVPSGTFSLQLFGRGRVRWDLGDGLPAPSGGHHSVQVFPASLAPSTLDGAWHHVACVRRFLPGTTGAQLELWVDGGLQATTTSPRRTDLTAWWASWSSFPSDQPGFFVGAEKISANGGAVWDSFKGRVTELRLWGRARGAQELERDWRNALTGTESGLLAWFNFREGLGTQVCDALSPTRCMSLERMLPPWW